MTTRAVASVYPRRGQWRCLWEGCPDFGLWITPPAGMSQLEDGQRHHELAHGVPANMSPEQLAQVDRGRLDR